MGGRGAYYGRSFYVMPSGHIKKEKPKAQKLEKDQATGVYKGERMAVDQADNHNANPSYRGGAEGRSEYISNKRAAQQAYHEYFGIKRDKLSKSTGMRKQLLAAKVKNQTAVARMKEIAKTNKAFSINCQRSIIAYEMRRRGYLVEAESNSGKDNDIGYEEFNSLVRNRSQRITLPRKQADRPIEIDKILLQGLQPGQRGIISWGWKGRSGHTINVERTSRGLLYVDAQTGRKAKKMSKYLGPKQIDRRGFTFMRSDNQEFDLERLVKNSIIRPVKLK